MSEPIDWYDKCQCAEAELLLEHAENARLREENQEAWNKCEELDERARHAEARLWAVQEEKMKKKVRADGVGLTRYAVEWLSWDKAKKLIAAGGGNPEMDSIWDFCDQTDIEIHRAFPSKQAAIKWAQVNSNLDIFNMPRIRETTLVEVTDDLGNPAGTAWERTGYWEVDGADIVEIESD